MNNGILNRIIRLEKRSLGNRSVGIVLKENMCWSGYDGTNKFFCTSEQEAVNLLSACNHIIIIDV